MPKDFDDCVKNGGKVRTMKMKGGYRHICFINGKPHMGEMHKTVAPKK